MFVNDFHTLNCNMYHMTYKAHGLKFMQSEKHSFHLTQTSVFYLDVF